MHHLHLPALRRGGEHPIEGTDPGRPVGLAVEGPKKQPQGPTAFGGEGGWLRQGSEGIGEHRQLRVMGPDRRRQRLGGNLHGVDPPEHQVLMGRDRRPAVRVVVVLADDHIAIAQQHTQLGEGLGQGEQRALPDQQSRQGRIRRQQLDAAGGHPGCDRGLAGEAAQRLQDAPIHHPGQCCTLGPLATFAAASTCSSPTYTTSGRIALKAAPRAPAPQPTSNTARAVTGMRCNRSGLTLSY